MSKLKVEMEATTVYLSPSLTGNVYHIRPDCRALRPLRGMPRPMSEWDATIYFGRFECYTCKPVKKGN